MAEKDDWMPVGVPLPKEAQKAVDTANDASAFLTPFAAGVAWGNTPEEDDWAPLPATSFAEAIKGDNGIKDRGSILPTGRNAETGELELAWPEMLRSAARGVTAFGNPAESSNEPGVEEDIFNAASFFASPLRFPGKGARLTGGTGSGPARPSGESGSSFHADPLYEGPSYRAKPKPPPAPNDWTPVGRGVEAGPNPVAPTAAKKPFAVRPDVIDLDENGNPIKTNLPAVRPQAKAPLPPLNETILSDADVGLPRAERDTMPVMPTFYSALTKGIEALPQEKAPSAQWQGIINNLRAKGVKQEEIDWSGVNDWLSEQKGPVSKQDLLSHLRENEVELQEVNRGSVDLDAFEAAKVKSDALVPAVNGMLRRNDLLGFDHVSDARAAMAAEPAAWEFATPEDLALAQQYSAARSAVRNAKDSQNNLAPKFESYVLPGGKNYREMLLTLPQEQRKLPAGWKVRLIQDLRPQGWADGNGEFITHEVLDDEGNQRGIGNNAADAINDAYTSNMPPDGTQVQPDFKSGHWEEPNILAHIRFDDRTGPNGEKVLHIAEVQSDWHQKGRKYGYTDPEAAAKASKEAVDTKAAVDQIEAEKEQTLKEWKDLREQRDKLDWRDPTRKPLEVAANDAFNRWHIVSQKWGPAFDAYTKARDSARSLTSSNRVPNAPLKAGWHELAMKRMLRYAAENGYDRVSWDTGKTNADRYNLTKYIKKLELEKHATNDKWQKLTAYDHDGHKVVDSKTIYDEKDLDDLVGKEIADRLRTGRNKELLDVGNVASLEGLDLNVGGEGMKGFYDQILPQYVNKYAKKWNTKVEPSQIGIGNASKGYVELNENYQPVESSTQAHSVSVTPEMRASVMKGQPMFERNTNARRSQPIVGTKDHTRAWTPKEKAFAKDVGELVKRLMPDAELRIFDKMRQGDTPITGLMSREGLKKVVSISLESKNPKRTAQHEAIHFLKDYLTEEEWATLEGAAEKEGWLDKHDIEKRYGELPDEIKLEEAIAVEFGDYRAGKPEANGAVEAIFAKWKSILDAIKTAFRRKFGTKATASDIFKDIHEGIVGKRKPKGERKVEPMAEAGGEGDGAPPRDVSPEGHDFDLPPEEPGALFRWIRGQEDDLTRLRGSNEADRTEAMNYIKSLPETLKDPALNEKLYHAIEDPEGTPLTSEEQALHDTYILPIRQEANEIFNRLRKAGVDIGMDGYVHRIVKGKGTMYDPAEGPPAADPFAGGRGLGQKTSSQHGRKMWMAEGVDGTKVIVNGDFKPGDTFTAKSGEKFTIRQATTHEIEEGSEVRYFKNALVNSLDNLLRLRRVERNINYLEALKTDPQFYSLAQPIGSQQRPPPNWKQTKVPQLRGWLMEPRIANMLDAFYEVGPQNFFDRGLARVNNALTSAIFVNPISALFGHGANVAAHWYVGRGWDNFNPVTVPKQIVNGFRALRDVWKMSPRYQQMLREGNSLLYAPTMNRDFHKLMIKTMGGEIRRDPRTWGEIAKIAGTSPKYLYDALSNVSSKGLWFANDVFMLQRVYDLMDKGKPVRAAIEEAEHEIPNYRIPVEAWDSDAGRAFSEVMRNKNIFIFSRYRYGAIHAYAKSIRDFVGKNVALKDRGKAAGQMLALGVLFGIIYPWGDDAAKKLTGNKNAYLRRAGPTTVADSIEKWASGDVRDVASGAKNAQTAISGFFGWAPATDASIELINNMDSFTSKRIYNPTGSASEIAQELALYAATRPFPLQQGVEVAEGRKDMREITASWIAIHSPTTKAINLRRHYAIQDDRANKKAFARKKRELRKAGSRIYKRVFGEE